jgi:TM2 domain-containing membrane protein YozV
MFGNDAGAQKRDFSSELKFAQYLFDKKLPAETEYVLNKQQQDVDFNSLQQQQKDSLYYQLGWVLYTEKKLEESSINLLNVSKQSPFYLKSRYFAAYNLAYLAKTDSATVIYNTTNNNNDSILTQLNKFELAGIALLRRDYQAFSTLKKSFTYNSYALASEEKTLDDCYGKLTTFPHKSPVIAGLLSAVIPGLGKIYAGKIRQGIGAFLPVAALGLLTYESYNKGGVKSARFIGFGSIFAIFYAGNIWGSAVSVKVNQYEFYHSYDNKILFNMHIPLRNIFN